ncbi:MAG: hypothetical protein CMJ86_05425 [Planctomycetes bacterium]|nr:hypothetical protein [Planctomycetota bacterium]
MDISTLSGLQILVWFIGTMIVGSLFSSIGQSENSFYAGGILWSAVFLALVEPFSEWLVNKLEGWGIKGEKKTVECSRTAADIEKEEETMKLHRLSAEWRLGVKYENGIDVHKNYVAACAWYSISAFNGDEKGEWGRDRTARKMTPEQIAEAQELFKELLKQIEENKKKAK